MVDLSKMHRSELEAIVVDQAKDAERFRQGIANIVRELDDEGDRVYLGSTNDADELRELDATLNDTLNFLECPWMHGTDLYAKIAQLRSALALAANRLVRCAVEMDTGSSEFVEWKDWAEEARATLRELE